MRKYKLLFPIFFYLALLMNPVFSQIPSSWQYGQENSLPVITLPNKYLGNNSPSPLEVASVDTIYKSLREKDFRLFQKQCQAFLKKYPQSQFRFTIARILKNLLRKNLQVYTLSRTTHVSGIKPELAVVGINIQKVEFSLWRVSLEEMIKDGIDIHKPVLLKDKATHISRWKIEIPEYPKWFSHKVTVPTSKQGCYILEANDGTITTSTFFMISDLSLLVKRSKNMVLASIENYKNQNPPGKCKVYLLDGGHVVYKGESNENGIWAAHMQDFQKDLTLAICQGNHVAIADSYWFQYEEAQQRSLIQTDKMIYRPGETVHVKGVLRFYSLLEKKYQIFQEPIDVLVQDDNWKSLYSKKITPNDWGTFSFSFPLPMSQVDKVYYIRLNGKIYARSHFYVQSLQSNLILSLEAQKKKISAGENIHLTAQIFSKEKEKHEKIKYSIWKVAKPFYFIDSLVSDAFQVPHQLVAEGTALTDKKGKWTLEYPTPKRREECLYHGQVWLENNETVRSFSNIQVEATPFDEMKEIKVPGIFVNPRLLNYLNNEKERDTLDAVLSSSQEKGTALVTVENSDILSYKKVPLLPEGTFFSQKITPPFSPSVFLRLTTTRIPGIKQTFSKIKISPTEKKLQIELAWKKRELVCSVKDSLGQPVLAEVLVLVEKVTSPYSSINLSNHPEYLYQDQHFGQVTHSHSFEFECQYDREHSFFPKEDTYTIATLTKTHIMPLRSSNLTETLWFPSIMTNNEGKAQLILPERKENEKLQATIIAIDKHTRIGFLRASKDRFSDE